MSTPTSALTKLTADKANAPKARSCGLMIRAELIKQAIGCEFEARKTRQPHDWALSGKLKETCKGCKFWKEIPLYIRVPLVNNNLQL